MSYLARATELQNMVLGGQLMEAFEKFYHEDVVMIEPTGESTAGKDANREREKKFLGSIAEFHGAGVDALTANEETKVSMAEVWMDVTFQDGNRVRLEQVTVQQWEGETIVKERFYYNMAG
ncbi:MAG: SnoaL-like domain-containing protein [Bacteroidota bacterium]